MVKLTTSWIWVSSHDQKDQSIWVVVIEYDFQGITDHNLIFLVRSAKSFYDEKNNSDQLWPTHWKLYHNFCAQIFIYFLDLVTLMLFSVNNFEVARSKKSRYPPICWTVWPDLAKFCHFDRLIKSLAVIILPDFYWAQFWIHFGKFLCCMTSFLCFKWLNIEQVI